MAQISYKTNYVQIVHILFVYADSHAQCSKRRENLIKHSVSCQFFIPWRNQVYFQEFNSEESLKSAACASVARKAKFQFINNFCRPPKWAQWFLTWKKENKFCSRISLFLGLNNLKKTPPAAGLQICLLLLILDYVTINKSIYEALRQVKKHPSEV